jgi:acetyl-CoA synthetase
MNLGGIKISSAEIERVLNQFEGIAETAAVAQSNDGGPDQLVVFVVANPDLRSKLDEASLLKNMNQILKSKLNPLFKIQSVIMVPSLPRTASGKVMRRKLRDELGSIDSPKQTR